MTKRGYAVFTGAIVLLGMVFQSAAARPPNADYQAQIDALNVRLTADEARITALEAAVWPSPTFTPAPSVGPSTPPPSSSSTPSPSPVPTATITPSPSPTPSPTPVPPTPTPTASQTASPATCPASLQTAINAASGTLDLTGCAYAGPVTIGHALTLRGVTITGPASGHAVYVTADNVTLDRLTISGARDGVWTAPVHNLTVTGSYIHDVRYSGVMFISVTGGLIDGNTIVNVGIGGSGIPGGGEDNAYNIAVTDQGSPRSSDVIVSNNLTTDNPFWHCLDTHGGLRITFRDNTAQRCSRAMFLTSSNTANATDLTIDGNQILSPDPVTYNLVPITLYAVQGADFTGNLIDGWGVKSPPASAPWYDYAGLSTGLTASGNTVIP